VLFAKTNVLTHRIIHCCFLRNAFYIINYAIAWFFGSLGWIALQRLFLIRARQPTSADLIHNILVWIRAWLVYLYMPKRNQAKKENPPGYKTIAPNEQVVKTFQGCFQTIILRYSKGLW